jgi:serine/threonine protein kinase/tetratricopeptide (TPR) repeat protein
MAEKPAPTTTSRTRTQAPTLAEKPAPRPSMSVSNRATRAAKDGSKRRTTRDSLEALAAVAIDGARAPDPDDPSTGRFAGRFELFEVLGIGGMATVYRARDRWLEELMAVKVLKPELASSPEAVARLRREALLARRVTHRNVVRVYDVGHAQGEHYLTMELVDGESLLERLGKPMPLRIALSIGAQLARALEAVHAAGVLHGDVKPENVLLEKGPAERVVLTDFGVSRGAADPPPPPLPGHAGGTPIYMAPEQIEGRAIGSRTDLFALGIVVYEMIAGAPPWSLERGSTAATMSRLAVPPTGLRLGNAEVSRELDAFVLQLLEREPSKRPATAAEVAAKLDGFRTSRLEARTIGAMPAQRPRVEPAASSGSLPRPGTRSLAVLQVHATGGGKSGYLAEAFTNELLARLSEAPRLRVVSRMAQRLPEESDAERRALGRQLQAEGLIEGSLKLRSDGALEVEVRLIEAESGSVLWSTQVERKAGDIFKLTAELGEEIARAFGAPPSSTPPPATLSAPDAPAVTAAPALARTPSPVPVRSPEDETLLGAHDALAEGTPDAAAKAERALTEMHEQKPEEPRITAMLALAKLRLWALDPRPAGRGPQERSLDEEAVRLVAASADHGPRPGMLRVVDALVASLRGRHRDAIIATREALRHSPDLPEARLLLGQILARVCEYDEADGSLAAALRADPSCVVAAAELARNAELAGKRSRADEWLSWGEENAPEHPAQLLVSLRIARWRRDSERHRAVRKQAMRVADGLRGAIASALRVAAGANEDVEVGRLAAATAVAGAPLEMSAHWMQLIAEQRAHSGDLPGVLSALRSVDGAGSIDVAWLDGCPLFEKVRLSSGFGALKSTFSARAREVRIAR